MRGPGSALYGANAFVAVINIITKDAEEIAGLKLTARGGSFNTQNYNLLGGNTFSNKLKISGSVDYYRTDGPELLIEEDRLTGTPWSLTPGQTDLSVEKTDIFVKVSYGDLTYSGHYLTKKVGYNIGIAYALVDTGKFKYDIYWHELHYKRDITESLTTNIKLFFDHFEQGGTFQIFPDGYLCLFPDGMIGGPYAKDNTYGIEAQFDYDISQYNHLILGILYEKMKQYDVKRISNYLPPPNFTALDSVQETSPDLNWNRDVTRELWALYVQDEWEIIDDVNFTAGVRHDHYSEFGGTTNPRVGLVWGFHEKADLKLLYGQAFRAPDFGELYTENNLARMGNPDLKPETIETYEAGIGLRPTDSLLIDMNFFYNKIDDMINIDDSTSPSFFANKDKAEVKGIELVMRGQYTPNNYRRLAYTYQDPRDRETDEKLPDVPSNRASGSINYGLTKHLNLHTDILWTGKRPRQSGDTRDDTPAYTTVDLAVTAKNFRMPVEIQAVIHNLFDENYVDPDRSGANQFVPNDFPREGISAMLSVSYKF